jgi:hypothetical protein
LQILAKSSGLQTGLTLPFSGNRLASILSTLGAILQTLACPQSLHTNFMGVFCIGVHL